MNEIRRTTIYIVLAVVSLGLAWWLSPPVEISPADFANAKVGKEFYPLFTNPNEPTSILVVGYDEAKAEPRQFAVKFENGKWTIPSHHNYPADGADRLAKTAASAMHIKRGEFISDSKQYHEQLGVVDPLDSDQTRLKGRGQRITLSKGSDVLMDLIVGKPVKDRAGFFYVRKPDEDATYVAKLDIDLSTKFKDWVETDLLKLNKDDLKEIVIDDYSIDEVNRRVVEGEISKLTRDKPADAWKLEGLDESKEELDVAKVNGMLGALDDLKLVGVRPKPKGLNPDLSFDEESLESNPLAARALVEDMARKGFLLTADPRTKKRRLLSNEGELHASTNKGVVYALQFGEVFSGNEEEVEVGIEKKESEGAEKEKSEDKDKAAEGKQPSRYLFVTTRFDASYIGPRPEKPERPEGLAADEPADDAQPNKKGAGERPQIKPGKSGKAATSRKPAKSAADEPTTEEPCGAAPGVDDDAAPADTEESDKDKSKQDKDEGDEAKPADETKKDGEPKAAQPAQPAPKSPEELKKEYDEKVRKYESDLKAYEDKVAAGKKLVDELNARFADWYYVISAENFNKLHLSRKDLVKEKAGSPGEKKADEKKSGEAGKDDPGSDDEESKDGDDPFGPEAKGPDTKGPAAKEPDGKEPDVKGGDAKDENK